MRHTLNVTNEIGRLRRVMLHRPGPELLNLSPQNLEPLLFDDIPFLPMAQREHDAFAQALREEGVEVVYLRDLLVETLSSTSTRVRRRLLEDYLFESGITGTHAKTRVRELLDAIEDTGDFVEHLISGVRRDEVDLVGCDLELADIVGCAQSGNPDLLIDPMPNLYFTRDDFTVVGHGVNINSMASLTRRRETLLAHYLFTFHPVYRDVPVWHNRQSPLRLEGGDFLNLTPMTVAIGISERTVSAAIDLYAKNVFWGGMESPGIEQVYAFLIPETRAMMHLDTVFTQLDVDAFLFHPGILDTLEVYRIVRGARVGEIAVTHVEGGLDEILGQALGCPRVRLVRCGGSDAIASAREQWNDGANCLAVAPGRVVVYQRNAVTNDILYRAGFDLIEIPSAELSRGRGGPHCMSMPFERDDL